MGVGFCRRVVFVSCWCYLNLIVETWKLAVWQAMPIERRLRAFDSY
jgi:hypothetical protein